MMKNKQERDLRFNSVKINWLLLQERDYTCLLFLSKSQKSFDEVIRCNTKSWSDTLFKIIETYLKSKMGFYNRIPNRIINLLKYRGEAFKIITVVSAFLVFGLSLRQKEFDRFGHIKPIFEILAIDDKQFSIVNHGGVAFFSGCNTKIESFPKKHSAVIKQSSPVSKENIGDDLIFKFSEYPTNQEEELICWYRDIDLNWYRVRISYIKEVKGFYIEDIPDAIRYEKVSYTLPYTSLDNFLTWIFPKNWFNTKISAPNDCHLQPFLSEEEKENKCEPEIKSPEKRELDKPKKEREVEQGILYPPNQGRV